MQQRSGIEVSIQEFSDKLDGMEFLSRGCAARSIGPGNALLGSFLSTIITLHCNISTSTVWPPDYGQEALYYGFGEYDFIVIGSGSAGSVVAGRLAENSNNRVLLLEAGGDPPIESEVPGLALTSMQTDIDWQYPTEARAPCKSRRNGRCTWHRGKALGGSHAINSMAYLRGTRRDFDDWERAGNQGWGWKDVQYAFRKTEHFKPNDPYKEHGIYGPLTIEKFRSTRTDEKVIMQAFTEMGYATVKDFVSDHSLGFGRMYGTLEDGRRMSTAKAFLTKSNSNLHVVKHAIAKKILFDQDLKADRVRFMYKGVYEFDVRAKNEVIVSAGAVESPKLLMLSGIGPRPHLKALNIPVIQNIPVGDSLEDHVKVELFLKFKPKKKAKRSVQFLDDFYNHLVHGKGPASVPGLDITGFISTVDDHDYPDVQYLFATLNNVTQSTYVYKQNIQRNIVDQVGPSERVIAAYVSLARPKSKGYIRLRSADYRDSPFIHPNYYDNRQDMKTMVRGIQKLIELENTYTFASLEASFIKIDLPECDAHDYRSKKYWECYIEYMSFSLNQPSSTAKMGLQKDKTTVVNSRLEVHGVKGLRVVDASVMPNTVSVISNAATIMIGEKGAQFVRSKWD